MTVQHKPDRKQRNLEIEQITQYLRKRPRILEHQPALVEILYPHARKSNSLLDMQQYMIENLQKNPQTLRYSKDKLTNTSQKNLKSQKRVHEAILKILDCKTLDELVIAILEDLPEILDLSLIALYFEKSKLPKHELDTNRIDVLKSAQIERHFG